MGESTTAVDRPRPATDFVDEIEAGSFRDRNGRIAYADGKVLRGVSAQALGDWQALSRTRFFSQWVDDGKLIPTRELEASELLSYAALHEWAGALAHERIPFVSYPFEWSFGMLKDAALLHLDLLIDALNEDMTLKDGSAYNVQWRGSRPVFIDIPSIERLRPGQPWVGYRQFCQLFLYPLLLQAHLGVPFQGWLRGSLDGIPVDEIARLFTVRHLVRAGVLKHVMLQANLQKRYADARHDLKSELRESQFDKRLVESNARSLRKLIGGLEWKATRSTWSHYAQENSYTDQDREQKERFVREAVHSSRRALTWDLGSNTGIFSRIAAENAGTVVAIDADSLAVERLYQSIKADGSDTILPLCMNLADPSPALGWRLRERKPLLERGAPDLTLCLAVLHHLVIGANVPLAELVDWLADLKSDLVVEFVTRADPQVQRLLRNRDDEFADYDLDHFERCLARRFVVAKREQLGSGTRVIYFARPAA